MNAKQFKAVTQCAGAKLRLPELVDLEIDILAVNITVWSNARKIESRHNTQTANRSNDCGQVQKGAHFPNVISNESASIPCDTVKRGKVTTNLMADEASQKTSISVQSNEKWENGRARVTTHVQPSSWRPL